MSTKALLRAFFREQPTFRWLMAGYEVRDAAFRWIRDQIHGPNYGIP
jgi:hypothetical protein